MERDEEYEEVAKQTSDDTESVEKKEEEDPRLELEEEEDDEKLQQRRKQEYEENMRMYGELVEQREKTSQHNIQLQAKLSMYFSKKPCDARPAEGKSYEELLQEYRTSTKIQAELKQQLRSKAAQLKDKLDEVENERLALICLQRTGESQAPVKSARPDVQLQQVVGLCRDNSRLRMRISRLVEQISTEEDQDVDPLQIQFRDLQLTRLEKERNTKTQEKHSKLQRVFDSSLEHLSNVKAKLVDSQREVQAKREQLAELEATLAEKRNVLTRIRQTRDELQRDNLRLKEKQGLLANKVLLRDYEDTMEAIDRLEERLLQLKSTAQATHK